MTTQDDTGGPARAEHDARRFARLLATEISVYHRDKVEVGRWRGDVYGTMREEIEAARRLYRTRVGTTPATDALFDEELGIALARCDDDSHACGGAPAAASNDSPDF